MIEPSNENKDFLNFPKHVLGREEERTRILKLKSALLKGQSSLLYLSGEMGMGKTFVVQNILGSSKDCLYVKAKPQRFPLGRPYACLQDLFRQINAWLKNNKAPNYERLKKEFNHTFYGRLSEVSGVIPIAEELSNHHEYESYSVRQSPIILKNKINQILLDFAELLVGCVDYSMIWHLDDLQWIDQGTANFLKDFTQTCPKSLLIVLAKRDKNPSPSYPFEDILSNAARCLPVSNIHLQGIKASSSKKLLQSLVGDNTALLNQLHILLQDKTNGNPYLMLETIKNWHFNGRLNLEQVNWDWQAEANVSTSNSTLELYENKMKELTIGEQYILKISACFGNHIHLPFISRISGMDQQEIGKALKKAWALGFIYPDPIEQKRDSVFPNNFLFKNDLVQDFLLDNLDRMERLNFHKRIAYYYVHESRMGLSGGELFDAIYQINASTSGNSSEDDKLIHAELNLKAAKKAKNNAATEMAMDYIHQSMNFAFHQSWDEHYDLASDIHIEGYQIARTTGYKSVAKQLFNDALKHLKKDELYELQLAKLMLDIQLGELEDALLGGVEMLKSEGLKVSANANVMSFLLELARTKWFMRGHSIESMYDLPELSDEQIKKVFSIIYWIFRSAQYLNPTLSGVLALKQLQLTIKHGTHGQSYMGLMAYGIIIGAGINDYNLAYDYCELGNKLAEKYGNKSGDVDFGKAIYRAYKNPLRDTLHLYNFARTKALKAGDFIAAGETTVNESLIYLASGFPLQEVLERSEKHRAFCKEHHTVNFYEFHTVLIYHVSQLLGNRMEVSEHREIEKIVDQSQFKFTQVLAGILKMKSSLYHEKWQEGIALAKEIEKDVPILTGLYVQTCFHFYKAALLLKLAIEQGNLNRSTSRQIKRIEKKMEKWSNSSPSNHAHRLRIIRGLRAQAQKEDTKALDFLETAAYEASNLLFMQNAGVSWRFIGDLQKNIDPLQSNEAYKKSRHLLSRWGFEWSKEK